MYSEPWFLTNKTEKQRFANYEGGMGEGAGILSEPLFFLVFLVKNQGSEYTSFGLLWFFLLFTMFSFHKEAW